MFKEIEYTMNAPSWLHVLLIWFIATFCMVSYYLFEHPLKKDEIPLEDLLHRISPLISKEYHHIITISALVIVIGFIALSPITTSSFIRILLFRLACFYLIRAFMVSITTLPCPYPTPEKEIQMSPVQKFLQLGGIRDNIPSGHAGVVFVTLFSAWQWNIITPLVGVPIFLVQLLSPTLTRQHYTIDPIISMFIAIVLTQNIYSDRN